MIQKNISRIIQFLFLGYEQTKTYLACDSEDGQLFISLRLVNVKRRNVPRDFQNIPECV